MKREEAIARAKSEAILLENMTNIPRVVGLNAATD
jgi:hypothetical protein